MPRRSGFQSQLPLTGAPTDELGSISSNSTGGRHRIEVRIQTPLASGLVGREDTIPVGPLIGICWWQATIVRQCREIAELPFLARDRDLPRDARPIARAKQ